MSAFWAGDMVAAHRPRIRPLPVRLEPLSAPTRAAAMERWGGRCVTVPEVLFTVAFHGGTNTGVERTVEHWCEPAGIAVLVICGGKGVVSFGRAVEMGQDHLEPRFATSSGFGAAWNRGHEALSGYEIGSGRPATIRAAAEECPEIRAARVRLCDLYTVVLKELLADPRWRGGDGPSARFREMGDVRAAVAAAARRRLIPLIASPRLIGF